jgi:hypothetical protein
MEISEFIKTQMTDFVKKFPKAKASYEYDRIANQHVIEILPQSVFDSKVFMQWEWDFQGEVIRLFPYDLIGFISEDAAVPLEKVDFSVTGDQYALPRKSAPRCYAETSTPSRMVCEGEIPYLTKE